MTDLKDKIKKYEAEITKLLNLLQADIKIARRLYENKEYAPTDILNLSDYLGTIEWHLCFSRDRLIGLSYKVNEDKEEYKEKEND